MFCESCGAKLKETAKFCGGCGTKVEIAASNPVSQVLDSIPLVALPEGVTGATVPVEILEVRAEGPDSDNNFNITVKCRCNNDTSDDWNLLKLRTQLLTGMGHIIDEANDTLEELIAGQSQFDFEPSFWGINASLLGNEPEQAHVVVFLTASRKFSYDLGKVSIPEVAFSTVDIPPKGMDALQMVSCSLWKGLPDDDKDSRIEVRAMLQNLTAARLPLVKIMAVVSDKQGEELATVDAEDELRAGELLVLNTSSYAKDKKLKGAIAALSIDMYWLIANGITQRRGMEIDALENEESQFEESQRADEMVTESSVTKKHSRNNLTPPSNIMQPKLDYQNLPFEIHYARMGVMLFELMHDTTKAQGSLSDDAAFQVSEGYVYNVGFRCKDSTTGGLIFVMGGRLEYVPSWLELIETNNDGLNIISEERKTFNFDEYGAVEFDDAEDPAEFEKYDFVDASHTAMFYDVANSDFLYLIVDAEGSRLKIDLEGFELDENNEVIGTEPILEFSEDQLDEIEVSTRDYYDIQTELGKWFK
jgi:hypothetical protein